MFNGIVETMGTIKKFQEKGGCHIIDIEPDMIFADVRIGDSIALNGVCLTVTAMNNNIFTFAIVPETLRRTNFDQLQINYKINLERSLTPTTRMGGHFVQGHVDCVGEIIEINKDQSDALLVKIRIPPQYAKYIVSKGYFALDGMSITLIDVGPDWFTVTFIPHTQAVTITQFYKNHQKLNIEVDIFAKYIEKFIGAYHVR